MAKIVVSFDVEPALGQSLPTLAQVRDYLIVVTVQTLSVPGAWQLANPHV